MVSRSTIIRLLFVVCFGCWCAVAINKEDATPAATTFSTTATPSPHTAQELYLDGKTTDIPPYHHTFVGDVLGSSVGKDLKVRVKLLEIDGTFKSNGFTVFVFISGNAEAYVSSTLTLEDTSTSSLTDFSSGVLKQCQNFHFDECFSSKYFTYSKRPFGFAERHIPHMFTGREVIRVDRPARLSAWTLTIEALVPHDMQIRVMVTVEPNDVPYTQQLSRFCAFFVGIVIFFYMCWGSFRVVRRRSIALKSSRQQEQRNQDPQEDADGPQEEDETAALQIPTTATDDTTSSSVMAGAAATATTTANVIIAEDEEEDPHRMCRICRTSVPRADLFAPCRCRGSVKYIHRKCLQQWREMTTNAQNRVRCSECHAPFVIVQHEDTMGYVPHFVQRTVYYSGYGIAIALYWIIFGFGFKVIAWLIWEPVLKWELPSARTMHVIEWDFVNLYHFYIAAILVFVLFWGHHQIVVPLMSALFAVSPRQVTSIRGRLVVLTGLCDAFVVVVLTPAFGFLAKTLVWLTISVPWEWTIDYTLGAVVLFLYTVHVHHRKVTELEAAVPDDDTDDNLRPSPTNAGEIIRQAMLAAATQVYNNNNNNDNNNNTNNAEEAEVVEEEEDQQQENEPTQQNVNNITPQD
eukprot:PhM_4_TR1692/c2_g2_i2/m.19010